MFLNRLRELQGLNRRYAGEMAELFVLYGRRRTGKSALLREFCQGKSHLYYLASQVRERDNLAQLREALLAAYPDPLLASMQFTSWEVVFHYLTQLAQRERFVVVLDEFPYLCQENPALPSIMQRWWDMAGKQSRMMLVLCGSHVGFMEQEILAERSTLFGRRTGQMRLEPLLPWDATRFFPSYTPRERLTAYGILGGIPAYLERFDPRQDILSNVLHEALDPQGFLYEEVHFLLRTELTQITTYLSLLKAVAGSATRLSEMASRAGIPATSASKYVTLLRDMGLFRREVPVTEEHPEKSKRGLYFINDPFVSFWCRFILPYQSLIQAGQGEKVWQEFIAPVLDTHLGMVFEDVCRQYVLHRWTESQAGVPRRVGRWWTGETEIDVLAELRQEGETVTLAGECKWWTAPVGENVLDDLQQKTQALPMSWQRKIQYALFAVNGFTEGLQERAVKENVLLFDGSMLLETENRQ